jgi:hypothetical protein
MLRKYGCLIALLGLVAAIPAPVWAQAYTSSLTGLVTDPSGAAVPGVDVRLTDVNKGYDYTAQSDSSGRYLVRSLPPGTYRLTATATGFKASVREGIVLNIDVNTNLDVRLEVGEPQQTVQVVGEAPLLATQDAVQGQTLSRSFVNDLPLLGRSVLDLARLAPGVTRPAGSGYGTGEMNNIVVNGSRNSNADVLVDGVSANIIISHGGVQATVEAPVVDAVQEFKIQTNFSADVAGYSGNSVINLVVRSGTNQFHGNLWEFFRNDKLAANDWFNNLYGNPRSILRYNQFGGTVGGPIKKNKTFFFFDYEGYRTKSPNTATLGVPSALERKGDFGEICGPGFDANGMCKDPAGQLWDPYTGVFDANKGGAVRSGYIPNNNLATYQSPGNPKLNGTGYQLPARQGNLIDPVASNVMQNYPAPNITGNRFANYFTPYSTPENKNTYGIKVDHSFSEKDRMSARFTRRSDTQVTPNVFGNALDPFSLGLQSYNAYQGVLNYTHVLNPRTLLNVSLGYIVNPVKGGAGLLDTNYPKYDISKDLGFPEYMKASGLRATPGITISNYASAGPTIGNVPWGFFWQTPETHHLLVTLSRLQGRHDLKFGWEGRLRRVSFLQPNSAAGVFDFSYTGTSQLPASGGGDAMASLLMGVGDGGSYEVPDRPATQSFQYAGFIQDNFRATSKLTLNVGLRYDISTPRTERFNHMNYVDPSAASPLQVPGLPNLMGGLVYADSSHRNVTGIDYKNFGPRFGFAYTLRPNFVVRGGYGLFYDPPRNGVAGTVASGFQGFSQTTNQVNTYQNDGATPWGRLSDPFPPNGPNLPIFNSQGLLSFVGDSIQGPIRSIHSTPYEQTWNLGLQRQMPGNILLEATYVGTKGTHLYYGGAEQLNHLPEIAGSSSAQITALNAKVANPFYGIIKAGALSGPTIPAYQLQLPYPQFTGFSVDSLPVANSIYHSLQLRGEKRLSNGVQFLVTYTFSKSIDDASAQGLTSWLGGSASLQDPNNRGLERGLSQFDATHVLNVTYVWDIPIGRGQLIGRGWSPLMNGILGGWKTNAIWQFASGQPLGLSLANGQSLPTYGSQRPNLLGTLKKASGGDSQFVSQYFANPEVAVAPLPFALGTAPRTLPNLRAPGIQVANLSLFKEFALGKFREGMKLEFRAEAFNALNHPGFCGPNTTVNGGSFGQITSANSGCGGVNSREVQLALKLYF